ncbi:nucleotidyltransferase [Lederbergia graminis]|uniref:Nucleotidyltransferase n=1 Tax=Lederbergia graminis TaxID=735518 RepID=A0ABW0LDS8_9BACI
MKLGRGNQMEELLQRICSEIQISTNQHEQAETSYKAVAKWLSDDVERFQDVEIDIYSQGSLRIGTTVQPIRKQEFDLDLVCELHLDWEHYDNPVEVLDMIEDRLNENETYKPMVERKNRCIRLNYKRNFHMDILPACPVVEDDKGCVKVPDRKKREWKDSNPKGYANWFERIAEDYEPLILTELFEKSAKIEPLPDVEQVELKPPLKRAIQLIKRHRDIYFKESLEQAPISIVLTTLAASLYNREGSVNEAITAILEGISNLSAKGKKIVVRNPMNELEILSERWDTEPKLYKIFVQFIKDFQRDWAHVNELKELGLPEVAAKLKEMFGDEPINKSFVKQASFNEALRNKGILGITTAGVVSAAPLTAVAKEEITRMPRNTFYGYK